MSIFNAIIANPIAGPAIDFQNSPNGKIILIMSPYSINLLTSNEPQSHVLGNFQLNQTQIDEYGQMLYTSWLSDTSFICFTSKGHILLCFISIGENALMISLKMAITSPPGGTFTAATAHNEYIFGGDNKGRLLIMSYKLASTFIHEVCDTPIKKICVLNEKGFIESEDNSIYMFDVNPDIYTNPNYELKPSKLEYKCKLMSICSSYIFIYASDDKIYYYKPSTDKEFKIIDSPFTITSMAPSNDGKCIYLAGQSRISKFNFFKQTITDIERSNLPEILAFAATTDILLISTMKGIYVYELLKQQDGCFYTQTAVYETKLLSNGVTTVCHSLPNEMLDHIKGIKIAAFSKSYIACVGINKKLIMYNLINNQWYIPSHPEIDPIMMTWSGTDLCVINYIEGTYSVALLRANMKTGFDLGHSSNLSFKPYSLSSYLSLITISLPNLIILLRKDYKLIRIKTPFTPIKILPFSSKDFIFALLMDKSLIAVKPKDPTIVTIATNVVNFFIDESLGTLTFATTKYDDDNNRKQINELSYCLIDNLSEIIKIGKFDGVPIYQFDSLPMVVQVLETDLLHPFFSEFNISLLQQNIKLAIKTLDPLRGYYKFTSYVTKIASQLVSSNKNIEEAIEFMKHYSEIFGNTSSDYFAFLTASEKKEKGKLTIFESKTNAFFDAYSLLKCIKKDEGDEIAYTAAILLLRQNLENDTFVVKILTFLEPVITRKEGISEDLIQYLEESVIQLFVDMFKKYRPDIALLNAKRFNRPLSDFIKGEKSVDSSFSVITIIEKIEDLMKSGKLSQKALNKLQIQMMRANWVRWLCACLAINDRRKDLLLVLGKRPKIKDEIANSEKWKHLLE